MNPLPHLSWGKCRREKPCFYHAAVLALRGKCDGFDAANGIDFYNLFSGELTIRLFPQGGYFTRNLLELSFIEVSCVVFF
jgi:hypothetical protein